MSQPSPHYLVLTPSLGGADGVSAFSRLIVRALQIVDGGPAVVVSLAESTLPETNGFDASRIRFLGAGGRKLGFAEAALRAGWKTARDTQVICVHLHQSPLLLPLAWRGARCVTMLCGIEAWKPLTSLQRQALLRSDVIAAISQHTTARFRAANPSFRDHLIHVCHLAAPDAAANGGVWHATPVSGPFALIVGRMAAHERYKGHDLLLDIWPRVITHVADARLVVAGEGDDRPRLATRAAQLGLRAHVTFLGRVSDHALARLYETCTFFVMPSPNEGFGLVFLEAMRAGKACICAPGAAAEFIQDGVTGLVVDPSRPGDVLNAVLRLFNEPGTRDRMGRAGAARFTEEFTEMCFQQRFRRLLGLGAPPC